MNVLNEIENALNQLIQNEEISNELESSSYEFEALTKMQESLRARLLFLAEQEKTQKSYTLVKDLETKKVIYTKASYYNQIAKVILPDLPKQFNRPTMRLRKNRTRLSKIYQ